MSGTITGGTQATNNVIGTGSSGVNLSGYTDQTTVSGQYITATGITATVRGRRVVYAFTGLRGGAVSFTSNRVYSGWRWNYKGDGTKDYVDRLWHKFDAAGTYTSSVLLKNILYTSGMTLTLSSAITIPSRAFTSSHDRSFVRNASDMVELTEHDESFMGVAPI